MTKSITARFIVIIVSLVSVLSVASAQESNAATFTVHVVQRGENLFRIALQYDLFAEQLAEANGITDDNAVAIGQRLIIPLVITSTDRRITHSVGVGETLNSIAAAYSRTASDLLTLNSLVSAEDIFIGQELIIVPGVEPVGVRATETTPVAEDEAIVALQSPSVRHSFSRFGDPVEAFVHRVQAGETLFEIGLRYNQTVDAVARANNLLDPSLLGIGQQLIIPGIQLPRLAQDLPEIVQFFTIDPLVFEEGRTGRIELLTAESATISGQLLGRDLRVIEGDEGKRHNILIAVPMFTETAVYPLTLSILDAAEEIVTISANLQVISGGYWRQSITINDSELVTPAVEDAEIALLVRLTEGYTEERSWNRSLSLPAAAAINALFGTLRSYNGSPFDRYHRGVDFAGAPGTSVLAAADGRVVMVDRLNIRGNATLIDHGWGLFTLYAHQQGTLVSPGEIVAGGQVIGTVGSTGRSTGPHLHWEVWLNGVNVDPMQWVQEIFP